MEHKSWGDVNLQEVQQAPDPVIKKGDFITGTDSKSELFELADGAKIIFDPVVPGPPTELQPMVYFHKHPWEHQVVVVSGNADFECVGAPGFQVGQGDVILVPADEKHSFQAKNGAFTFLRFTKPST